MKAHLDIEISLTPERDESTEDLVAMSRRINDEIGEVIDALKGASVAKGRQLDLSAEVYLSEASRSAMKRLAES